jgi:hypothetical protein
MIVGFILPKRLPGTASTRLAPRAVDPLSHLMRTTQVHVIGHHCPCAKFVELPFAFSDYDGVGYQIRDSRVREPAWSYGAVAQGAVVCC